MTDAAVNNKVDHLEGLKENVIVGKLIPTGTGSKFHRVTTDRINEMAEEMIEIRHERNAEAEAEREANQLPRINKDDLTDIGLSAMSEDLDSDEETVSL